MNEEAVFFMKREWSNRDWTKSILLRELVSL